MTKLSSKISHSRRKARKIMFKHLKMIEPFPPGCCIHHKDRNPLNNDIDNLQIMGSGEHISMHYRNDGIAEKVSIKAAKDRLEKLESRLVLYNNEMTT